MNQDDLFTSVGFTPVIYKGQKKYQGTDGRYYSLEITDHYFGVWITSSDGKKTMLCKFYRIFDLSRSEEILKSYITRFSVDGYESVGTAQSFREGSVILRSLIGEKLDKVQWENLCRLYFDAVRAGGNGQILADTCKEIIQIMQMREDAYVDPELHHLLLKVPDTYYDFIIGEELSMDGNLEIQHRLLNAMRRHPDATSSEVIVYTSILISNPNDTEAHLDSAVKFYRENQDFEILNTPDEKNELTQERNKGGWKITTIFIHGFGFTLRQSGPIIFIDYQNRCVGGIILYSPSDTEAGIVALEVSDVIYPDAIRSKLVEYAERVAAATGKNRICVLCPPNDRAVFMDQGYIESEDDPEVFIKRL